MIQLQSHLETFFSDQTLDNWISLHDNLFTLILKLPHPKQSPILTKLFKKYLKQIHVESDNLKKQLQSSTKYSLIPDLNVNIENFLKSRMHISKSIVMKIFMNCNINYVEGFDECKEILKNLINDKDSDKLETGLDLIYSYFRSLD